MQFGKNKKFLHEIKTREDAQLLVRMLTNRMLDIGFLSRRGRVLLFKMARADGSPLTRWERKVLGKRHPLVLNGSVIWRAESK